jgi:hypothetical protein
MDVEDARMIVIAFTIRAEGYAEDNNCDMTRLLVKAMDTLCEHADDSIPETQGWWVTHSTDRDIIYNIKK